MLEPAGSSFGPLVFLSSSMSQVVAIRAKEEDLTVVGPWGLLCSYVLIG